MGVQFQEISASEKHRPTRSLLTLRLQALELTWVQAGSASVRRLAQRRERPFAVISFYLTFAQAAPQDHAVPWCSREGFGRRACVHSHGIRAESFLATWSPAAAGSRQRCYHVTTPFPPWLVRAIPGRQSQGQLTPCYFGVVSSLASWRHGQPVERHGPPAEQPCRNAEQSSLCAR